MCIMPKMPKMEMVAPPLREAPKVLAPKAPPSPTQTATGSASKAGRTNTSAMVSGRTGDMSISGRRKRGKSGLKVVSSGSGVYTGL